MKTQHALDEWLTFLGMDMHPSLGLGFAWLDLLEPGMVGVQFPRLVECGLDDGPNAAMFLGRQLDSTP